MARIRGSSAPRAYRRREMDLRARGRTFGGINIDRREKEGRV